MEWLFGGSPDHRRDRMRRLFDTMLAAPTYRRHAEVHLTADGSGSAIWLRPPGHFKQPMLEQLRLLPRLVALTGARTPQILSFMMATEKQHPTDRDHWYLMALAVRRGEQGKGVGSALLSFGLRRVDEEGLPAYLESSNPRNIGLYERHEFRVTRRLDLQGGAPVATAMWREPRAQQ